MSASIRSAVRKALISRATAFTTATALFGFATSVAAQDNTPSESTPEGAESIEEVVVTGFRASLNAALTDKRTATGAVDSIRSEDIAKFPDSNLAESVQRVPGVSISRDAGEGRNISVRGLGPQFTRVRINGMEAMTTTGGTDSSGGSNRNRQFDFNVFASELFNSITARKTASADIDEGSLGATVDLQTARPFDFDEFTMVGGLKAAYNDLGEDVDPRATFLVSNTFGDGKLGVLFSAAYAERNLVEEGPSTVRWDIGTSVGGFNPMSTPSGITLAQANAAFHPRIPRYGRLTHEQDRLGLTSAIQFQPNEANLVTLDLLYSDFEAKRDENFLEAFSFSRTAAQQGKPQSLVLNGAVDAAGTLVAGTFDDVDIRSESRHDELQTIFYSATVSASHQLNEHWTLSELVGYSRSDFNNPIQTTITLDRANSDGYSWDFSDSRAPVFNYNFDVTNPASWVFATTGQSEIRIRPQGVDNTFQVAKIDLKWAPSDAFALKFGLDYKEFDFVSWERRRASETAIPALPAGTTLADFTELLTGYGDGLDMGTTPASWLIPNLDAFVETFDIYSETGIYALGDITNAAARGNNRSVNETNSGAYVQASFNMDWGMPVRGDLGVRYVKTEQESVGYVPAVAITQATAENEYSDVLPSLNLVAELTPDLLLRFGAAKVMTRPALGNITPGGAINLVGNLTVTTGNPLLKPTRAKTYDLGLEWYFQEGSLLSGAIFYKDIDTFVQTLVEPIVFNQSGLPLALLAGTTLTGNETFNFQRPVNTEGGPLEGFEINYQQQFKFLPGIWSNFGALLNYTYVDSKIDYVTSTNPTAPRVENDLVNLSRNAWNATLYYEANGLSLRTSASYRDSFLTNVPAANAPTIQDAEGTNDSLFVDFSASYAINDNLAVSLEAQNLTDEFNDQFIDTASDRVVVYTHTGRQVYLGARYKF
jgi:iron complex outermembrane recepter protein